MRFASILFASPLEGKKGKGFEYASRAIGALLFGVYL
jgi:hypothetical protein